MTSKKVYLFCVLLVSIFIFLPAIDQDTVYKNDRIYMEAYFNTWFSGKHVVAIEPLKGGTTDNRLYTITFNTGDSCVARLLTNGYLARPDWQAAEIEVMLAAEYAGVGPRIIAAHIQDHEHPIGYIVMEKVTALLIKNIPWDSGDTYRRLGCFLAKMHTQPSSINVDKSSIYERMHRIIYGLRSTWRYNGVHGLPEQLDQVIAFFERVYPVWSAIPRTHLVHGDLLLSNLLYDGVDFVAVDWELSQFVADPLFDLALVYDGVVPKKHRGDFIRGYCKKDRLSPEEYSRFKLLRCMAGCFVGLAYATSNPLLFAEQFHEYTKNKTDIQQALHAFVHNGFTINTADERATFGTLLFMQAYKWLEQERLPDLEKALTSVLASSRKQEEIIVHKTKREGRVARVARKAKAAVVAWWRKNRE